MAQARALRVADLLDLAVGQPLQPIPDLEVLVPNAGRVPVWTNSGWDLPRRGSPLKVVPCLLGYSPEALLRVLGEPSA